MARFLALGDSYTIGEGVERGERWPVQLARLLQGEGAAIEEPEIVAVTGWTTDELAAGIERAAPHGPFDLVSLLIGVNNQYRGRGTEEYREQLGDLLREAVRFAGGRTGRVVVVSIPDWGVTPFAGGHDRAAIGREIDAFNDVNRACAADSGARYVDVTEDGREHPDDVVGDGLHPSAASYGRWAVLVLEAARAALGGDQGPIWTSGGAAAERAAIDDSVGAG